MSGRLRVEGGEGWGGRQGDKHGWLDGVHEEGFPTLHCTISKASRLNSFACNKTVVYSIASATGKVGLLTVVQHVSVINISRIRFTAGSNDHKPNFPCHRI